MPSCAQRNMVIQTRHQPRTLVASRPSDLLSLDLLPPPRLASFILHCAHTAGRERRVFDELVSDAADVDALALLALLWPLVLSDDDDASRSRCSRFSPR